MPNGTTPTGLTRQAVRQVQTRGALGMSNISKEAQDVFRMLSGYLTDIKERRLSGGEKATEVEKEQKKQGDWWGYGSGLVTFLVLSPIIGPAAAAGVSGIASAGVRKGAEDLTRLDVGVGGIALGKDELPLPPKPKYYQTQYEKLPIARREAKFDLENLYQMGRQMALPRALGTGYNVYRGANLASDAYSGIKDMFADKTDDAGASLKNKLLGYIYDPSTPPDIAAGEFGADIRPQATVDQILRSLGGGYEMRPSGVRPGTRPVNMNMEDIYNYILGER